MVDLFSLIAGPVLAFILTLAVIPVLRVLALKIGFVDEPGGRKHHDTAVPPIGGLVIFPVYMAVAVFWGIDLSAYGYLFIALIVILMTGAIDDLLHISPWIKFSMQFAVAALIVLAGHAQLDHLGNLFGFGDVRLGLTSIPFSIVAVVLLVNAINLMDGLDGLAAGKSFIVLLWLILACFIAGESAPVYAMGPLMGALLGFLLYNMRHPLRDKACVFLGDAGSMGLGLVLAWFCIGLAQDPDPVLVPISIAWVLALPIIDSCGQFYRRVREGRHPFSPDRGHFHHHFIHAGIPVGQSTALILLLGFVLGGIGYFGILVGVPQYILTALWVLLLLSHIALSQRPETYIDFLTRFKNKFS